MRCYNNKYTAKNTTNNFCNDKETEPQHPRGTSDAQYNCSIPAD